MALPTVAITPHASGAENASGAGASVDLGTNDSVWLDLDVTAAAGSTPSLVVTLETSRDGVSWRQVGTAFATRTAAGTERKAFGPCSRYVRARWTITGSGATFTFALTGTASRPYANLEDLVQLGINAAALTGISDERRMRALETACTRANDLLADARYTLPLTTWGDSLRNDVAALASWELMSSRGFNPEAGSDLAVRKRYDDAMAALKRGSYSDIVDSTPTVDEGETYVTCGTPRRWGG